MEHVGVYMRHITDLDVATKWSSSPVILPITCSAINERLVHIYLSTLEKLCFWELSNLQAVDDFGPALSDLEARITGTIKPTGLLTYLAGIRWL